MKLWAVECEVDYEGIYWVRLFTLEYDADAYAHMCWEHKRMGMDYRVVEYEIDNPNG